MSSRYSDLSLYKRIASEARPYWAHLAGICLLSLLVRAVDFAESAAVENRGR